MRAAAVLLASCVLLAGPARPAGAQPAATAEASRIYGVEVETSPVRDRLLVFADGLLRPRLEPMDAGAVMLSFPGATLDPSAPRQLSPEPGGAVKSVTVFETADEPREVRITVLHSAGLSPSLSQRGGQVALDFRRPGRITRPAPGLPAERTLDARWLDMRAVTAIEKLARFLDRRVILDDGALTGNVSVEAPRPITREEAADLFDALLLLKGLAGIRGPGDAIKLVPLAANPGRWAETLAGAPDGEALVTLVPLREVDAGMAAQAIEPLVGKDGFVQILEPRNALLLAGVKSRLERIASVLRELDDQGATRVVMIPLRHADAEQTEAALTEAFDAEPSLRVWSDARSQRLIVRGRYQALERVRDFVARVDRPVPGQGRMQVIPVQYADAERMANLLRDLAAGVADPTVRGAGSLAGREFAVSVHGPSHSLVVRGDPETLSLIREVLAEIDRIPQRVLVEVGVMEVSYTSNFELAFDSILPLVEPKDATDLVVAAAVNPSGSLLDTTPSGSFFGRVARSPILVPIVDPITGQSLVLPIPRETAVLTANVSSVRSRLVSRPQLSLLSGEEHEIFVGNNVPVPTAATGAVTNPLRTSQTVERRDTGVSLRVRPSVPEEGPIALEVQLELSGLSGGLPGGPTFRERKLEARMHLESGRTAVIGSAELPTVERQVVGVPFLMDIPILGWFFRSTQDIERRTHLLITLTAVRQHAGSSALTGWMLERLAEREKEVAAAP